jgi:hypothetical protein
VKLKTIAFDFTQYSGLDSFISTMKDKSGEFPMRLVLHTNFREKNQHLPIAEPISKKIHITKAAPIPGAALA